MLWVNKTYHAPPNSGKVTLGRTVPSLLDEACDRVANVRAFNQWTEIGWQPLSHQEFRAVVESLALGLLELNLETGDRVALLMHSDVYFCIADIGCLLAGLVDVPIDLTQTIENIIFVIRHSEAKVLIISNQDLLSQLLPYLGDIPHLTHVVLAETRGSRGFQPPPQPQASAMRGSREQGAGGSRGFQLLSFLEVQARGQAQNLDTCQQQLRTNLTTAQLATIIYIPSPTGELQGVMLTHENLSANALAAFSELPDLAWGEDEVALSFLPLTHVFARALLYGHISYGHCIYFSNANRVMKHLKEVQPTLFATVPLLLERFYSKGLDKANKSTSILERKVFHWALNLAKKYDLEHPKNGHYALLLKLADEWVLSQWRSLFGGRMKYVLSGGAALKAELANVFGAAGVKILQGYGLTQTSSVICYNRGGFNRAGTVGVPIAGAELKIADDGEILVRGPYVTQGYYKNPEATREAIDEEGWFHTGDLGAFSEDGFLQITGLKKALFKLSTGKYIAPQPLEALFHQSPLVERAVVIGSERKFCAVLLFPNREALQQQAREVELDIPMAALLQHPCILALYQAIVDVANCHLPYWATMKRFQLIDAPPSVESGLLPATDINRRKVMEVFAKEIEALYGEETTRREGNISQPIAETNSIACLLISPPACPAFAQSLNPRLTS
jgi:long-chain acyl-CoA synthetase